MARISRALHLIAGVMALSLLLPLIIRSSESLQLPRSAVPGNSSSSNVVPSLRRDQPGAVADCGTTPMLRILGGNAGQF
jgi:hypothetical protein